MDPMIWSLSSVTRTLEVTNLPCRRSRSGPIQPALGNLMTTLSVAYAKILNQYSLRYPVMEYVRTWSLTANSYTLTKWFFTGQCLSKSRYAYSHSMLQIDVQKHFVHIDRHQSGPEANPIQTLNINCCMVKFQNGSLCMRMQWTNGTQSFL